MGGGDRHFPAAGGLLELVFQMRKQGLEKVGKVIRVTQLIRVGGQGAFHLNGSQVSAVPLPGRWGGSREHTRWAAACAA